MVKVTNTGAAPIYIVSTQIPPHATVEVSDEDLAKAKEAKIIVEWFANGTLKVGDEAAQEEAEKQHPPSTPASGPGAGSPAYPGGVVRTTTVQEKDLPPKK